MIISGVTICHLNFLLFKLKALKAGLYHETWHVYVSVHLDSINTRFNNPIRLYESTTENCFN